MKAFYVRAEPIEGGGTHAAAVVVADNEDEALLLLRKDYNFGLYRLPPLILAEYPIGGDRVRRALGDAARREKGVYAFALVDSLTDAP